MHGLRTALAFLLLAACDCAARSPVIPRTEQTNATAATTPSPFVPASCPARLAAAAASAARRPGRSRLTSRALVITVLARPDAAGGTCEGVVDVAWFEAAPPELRSPDAQEGGESALSQPPLRVIRRLWQRGRVRPGDELTITDEHDEPRGAWLISGEVEACKTGPLAQLGLVTAAEVKEGFHVVVPPDRSWRCFAVQSGAFVVPSGELLRITQTTDTSNTHYAFRVTLEGEPVWIVPTVLLRGRFPNPVAVHSAIDGDAESLDCEPDQHCWGTPDEAWGR